MDVLLMPDQMMLQIHESIGHPLELDRILGDERNFAGTSFVTLDMFGHYAYGSELLNVSYDPTRPEQLASFWLRRRRPAGAAHAADRARYPDAGRSAAWCRWRARQRPGLPAWLTTRSASWNRAPIDRMSNLNIEPGSSTLEAMIASIELGVMMRTNVCVEHRRLRNKFQFGCEWGRMISNGRFGLMVRDPATAASAATFWRTLANGGRCRTFEVMGTPHCGRAAQSGDPSAGAFRWPVKFGVDVVGRALTRVIRRSRAMLAGDRLIVRTRGGEDLGTFGTWTRSPMRSGGAGERSSLLLKAERPTSSVSTAPRCARPRRSRAGPCHRRADARAAPRRIA